EAGPSTPVEIFGLQDVPNAGDEFAVVGSEKDARTLSEHRSETVRQGAGEILLTSMDADGTKAGYDTDLLRAVCRAVRVPVIASGGAGRPSHFADAFRAGADAALAASLFHFRELSINRLRRYLAGRKIPIRRIP
ncbi:MAG TPA: HisA/HisF-related TIM barrel protein, partial [Elusimicrobiota bacterium]|nr:HisA/HisF-related TIM barrel protein [Elusimicrobiota bacterium]